MHLTKAQAVLRPRNPWQAMDLGVQLARRHAGLLMLTWAAVSLPLFALLTVIFWQHPSIAVLIIWWLKPAFERLPLYILSNALFANPPSFTASLKAFPKLLKPQLIASLTWRRLSLTRSFDLPVLQLEGLSGSARQQRLTTLARNYNRAATWLTIIGLHIEMALCLGLIVLLYLLVPAQLQENWSWLMLLEVSHKQWLWLEHLSNLLYVLVLIVWQPIYVACGFTLYLNRRTQLEAWDIELAFRSLAQRLTKAGLPIMAALLFCLPHTNKVLAEPLSHTTYPDYQNELAVNEPRLLKQMLTSEQAQHSINNIVHTAPFTNHKTVTRWQFNQLSTQASQESTQLSLPSWLSSFLHSLSFSVQAALWGLVGLLGLTFIWRYRYWLRLFGQKITLKKSSSAAATHTIFGLAISRDSLPDDPLASAQALWSSDPRAALSLLYRALLNHLVDQHGLPLHRAHTEHEVLAMTLELPEQLQHYTQHLTQLWIQLAWGQQLPRHEQFVALCKQYSQLLEREPD